MSIKIRLYSPFIRKKNYQFWSCLDVFILFLSILIIFNKTRQVTKDFYEIQNFFYKIETKLQWIL